MHRRVLLSSARQSSGLHVSSRLKTTVAAQVGDGDPLQLTTGHMARFAAGAVVASRGDNAVLATCVYKANAGASSSQIVPLTVDFRQSAAAIGKIPTNYLRRELGQSDADILTSRVIDRSLRPLFPYGWGNDTQIVCKPLALDDDGDGAMLAINAAAAALHVSPVPFGGPVGAVRLAYIKDEVVVNPTKSQLQASRLDMILSGCGAHRTVMIEMDGQELSIGELQHVIDTGLEGVDKILDSMNDLQRSCGKPKAELAKTSKNSLFDEITKLVSDRVTYVLTDSTHDKVSRDVALKEVGADLLASFPDQENVMSTFYDVVKQTLRNLILDLELRCDGRFIKEFRPITINVDVYKKLHGSALFQRGQTQVLSTVTFDSPSAAFHPDSISQILGAQRKKMFMLHYEFPSYATNEISTSRGSNRRELGHGALAEKALKHVIPTTFPYSLRLACQVLESNGSSSMASACAGSLAMYDAGVPLKAPVAGVAIGLVTDPKSPDDRYKVLTDILGIEDYAGDMDFKIAGSRNGFTAIQLDVKIGGLSRKQLDESLERGRDGIEHVLGKMDEARSSPRESFKQSVPVMETMELNASRRQILFRGGGMHVKNIEAETGVKISHEDDRNIHLFAPNAQQMMKAKELVEFLAREEKDPEVPFGSILQGVVESVHDRGVNVRFAASSKIYFVPNAQLTNIPIKHPSAVGIEVGQKLKFQWLGHDNTTGQVRLSRRTLATVDAPNKAIRTSA